MDCVESVSDSSDDCNGKLNIVIIIFLDFYDNDDPDVDHHSEDISLNTTANNIKNDPEYVEYKCLEPNQLEEIFNKSMDCLNQPPISINLEIALLLLHLNNWNVEKIREQLKINYEKFLQQCNIKDSLKSFNNNNNELYTKKRVKDCYICFNNTTNIFNSLDCAHLFCPSCWFNHIEIQLQNGIIFFFLILTCF